MESKYIVNVYVGVESGADGTPTAVVLADNEPGRLDKAVDRLEEALDIREDENSGDFNWNVFHCQIPDFLVEQIRKDAVKDYLKQLIP